MTFADAIARLLAGDERDEVWRAVTDALAGFGQRNGVIPAFRDDAVAFAYQRVVEMLDDGRLATVKHPDFYFASVVRNRSISLWRKERPREAPPPPVPAPEPTVSMARVCEIVEDLKASALKRRPAQHRAEIEASIDRMLKMAMEGLHTRDVAEQVARDEGVALATEKDRERFVNVLDRRHSRARAYLLEVVTRRRLDPEADEEAREAVRLLRRRQENRRRASAQREAP